MVKVAGVQMGQATKVLWASPESTGESSSSFSAPSLLFLDLVCWLTLALWDFRSALSSNHSSTYHENKDWSSNASLDSPEASSTTFSHNKCSGSIWWSITTWGGGHSKQEKRLINTWGANSNEFWPSLSKSYFVLIKIQFTRSHLLHTLRVLATGPSAAIKQPYPMLHGVAFHLLQDWAQVRHWPGIKRMGGWNWEDTQGAQACTLFFLVFLFLLWIRCF